MTESRPIPPENILSSPSLSYTIAVGGGVILRRRHGNQVAFDISAVLPPKILPTGKVYTLNTTYQYGDKEIEVGSIEFSAEDYPQSSSTASRVSRTFSMPYNASLNPGSLVIQGEAKNPKNGKALTTAKMEIAVGIITTSRVQLVALARAPALSSGQCGGH